MATDPVSFDIDADGDADRIGWTNPATDEAFLWIDLNDDHQVNDGRELFGIATRLPDGSKAGHGFIALQSYDLPVHGGNADGRITSADVVWGRLRLWVDADHDGRSTIFETGPMQSYGVTALELAYMTDPGRDPAGNEHRYRGTYHRRVVREGPAEVRIFALDDVFFAR